MYALFLDVCTCRDSRPVYDHLIKVTHRDHMTDPVVHPLPRVLRRPTHELRLSIRHPARALDCAGGHMSTNRSTGQTYLQKARQGQSSVIVSLSHPGLGGHREGPC